MPTNTGDVDISLNGDKSTLRCTLRAAKEINASFGDYVTAQRRLATYDLAAYVAIVAAGLGKTSKEVEAAVYNNGMVELTKPLSDYVNLLANGGRPLKTDDEAAKAPAPGEG